MSKNHKTISKKRILEYLEFANDEVDIHKLVKWLQVVSEGAFTIVEPMKSLSLTEQLRRRV